MFSSGIRKNKAFTLVELSIVLIIIGLIIGGVLTGQNLIEQAELSNFKRRIDNYELAISVFKLKYSALPGDISPRKAVAFGFLDRAGTTNRGDSNNRVSSGNNLYAEAALFWRDLSDAGLIEESFTIYNDVTSQHLTTNTPEDYIPRLDISVMAYPYIHYGWSAASNASNVHVYRIFNGGTTNNSAWQDMRYAISAEKAYMIDQKFDDGMPDTGKIRRYNGSSCISGGNYNTSNSSATCGLLFLSTN